MIKTHNITPSETSIHDVGASLQVAHHIKELLTTHGAPDMLQLVRDEESSQILPKSELAGAHLDDQWHPKLEAKRTGSRYGLFVVCQALPIPFERLSTGSVIVAEAKYAVELTPRGMIAPRLRDLARLKLLTAGDSRQEDDLAELRTTMARPVGLAAFAIQGLAKGVSQLRNARGVLGEYRLEAFNL